MRSPLLLVMTAALFALPLVGMTEKKSIVPPYEVIKTRNGVQVYYFASSNVPLFEVKLAYDFGTDLDPDGKSGLAMFAAAMTRRGLPDLDENAITRKLDDVAGGVDNYVGE